MKYLKKFDESQRPERPTIKKEKNPEYVANKDWDIEKNMPKRPLIKSEENPSDDDSEYWNRTKKMPWQPKERPLIKKEKITEAWDEESGEYTGDIYIDESEIGDIHDSLLYNHGVGRDLDIYQKMIRSLRVDKSELPEEAILLIQNIDNRIDSIKDLREDIVNLFSILADEDASYMKESKEINESSGRSKEYSSDIIEDMEKDMAEMEFGEMMSYLYEVRDYCQEKLSEHGA